MSRVGRSGAGGRGRARRQWFPAVAVGLVSACVAAWVLLGGEFPGGGDARAQRPGALSVALASRGDLSPPEVVVERRPEAHGGRFIFISPRAGGVKGRSDVQQGGMMLDDQGRVVWFKRTPDGDPITDLRVQEYQGEPVLTWWQGATTKLGTGTGVGRIVDRRYRHVATVQAGRGETADLHEFLLTRRGTALVTIYSRKRQDLRDVGLSGNAQVTQGIVQEIDVESGEVLFEWESLDHVAPTESYKPPPVDGTRSWDYFHINAVNEDADGDLLVTARNTNAVYKVDRETGDVEWRLGGRKSDFEMGPGAGFEQQHDARWVGRNRVMIFDNVGKATEGEDQPASSVKVLALDEERMTAELVDEWEQPHGLWAESQGNAQPLPDGGLMVGWGSTGWHTWFGAEKDVVFDAHLPEGYDSYRAYLYEWDGMPRTRPAIAAEARGDQLLVHASWNGATLVRAWQVLAGPRRGALRPVGEPVRWDGLETTITVPARARLVAVQALGENGRPLGRSRAARPGPVGPERADPAR